MKRKIAGGSGKSDGILEGYPRTEIDPLCPVSIAFGGFERTKLDSVLDVSATGTVIARTGPGLLEAWSIPDLVEATPNHA